MTPGYTTTEFWVTVVSYIISLLTLFRIGIPTSLSSNTQVIAVAASGVATAAYAISRMIVKKTAIENAVQAPATTAKPVSVAAITSATISTQTTKETPA